MVKSTTSSPAGGFLEVPLVTLPVRSVAEAEAPTTSKVAKTRPKILPPGTNSEHFFGRRTTRLEPCLFKTWSSLLGAGELLRLLISIVHTLMNPLRRSVMDIAARQ